MGTRVDTVVVGGGIIGSATAFWLARRGLSVALFEAGRIGSGDTSASAAIVRMHYTNPVVVRMALRAREIFAGWESEVGGPTVYTPSGWFFLLPPKDARQAQANVAMQRQEGVDVEEVDFAFLASKFPSAVPEGIGAIYFEPASGYADPVASCRSLAAAAERYGALVVEGRAIRSLAQVSGRTIGVISDEGELIRAEVVVLAAGAGSVGLAATAGHDLPIQCTREQEVVVADPRHDGPSCSISSVVDRIYSRPYTEDGAEPQVLVGRGYPKAYEYVDPDRYARTLDRDFELELRERISERSPTLGSAPLRAGYAALYDVTPDWHPVLGPLDSDPGLWLAAGGSGHGFKLGPAIGEMLAGAIANDPVPYASLGDFSVHRFARGTPFRSAFGANRA